MYECRRMITPLLPFLSLSRMSYHPPPAYVQMNCEMDRITATFFASQMPYPPPSAYAQMLWKMDHATSTFCYGGWLFGVTWWVFITWTSVWISVSVVLFVVSQACCGLNEETIDSFKKLLCLWSASQHHELSLAVASGDVAETQDTDFI
jgi:hypothetical protein